MSSLIKSNIKAAKGAVPLFAEQIASKSYESAPSKSPLDVYDTEVARLQNVVEDLRSQISTHGVLLDQAREEGKWAGREAAESEYNETREAQLVLLQTTYEAARSTFSTFLEQSEALSVLIAKEVLEKIFGSFEGRSQMVVDVIRHQLSMLSDKAKLIIQVSRIDFPDTSEVKRFAASIGLDEERISILDSLNSGDCLLKLKLGTLDVGIDQQWDEILTLFAEQTKVEVGTP
jgi:flagellar biosynthesis/type III secretory pathway protein FliH